MKKLVFLAAAALVGCVTTSEVVPMGKDSYTLTGTARGGFSGDAQRIEGLKTANAWCEAKGLHMILRRADTGGRPGFTPVTTAIVFSCVTTDDPEWQRPNVRPDPTVVIEDQRG